MKNKFEGLASILFLIFLLFSCSKKSETVINQPPTSSNPLEKVFGGPQDDNGKSLIIENDEIFILGTTKSLGDLNGDLYLLKTDLTGNILLEKSFGGGSEEEGVKIIATIDGNFILLGSTQSSGAGQKDIFVIKVDKQGNQIWEKTYGGSLDDTAEDIVELSNTEFCIAGTTESFGSVSRNIYMVWIDQNGNLLREKTHGGSDIDGSSELMEIDNQEIMLYGYTKNYGATSRDFYLLKTNFLGDSLWSQRYGGTGYEESQSFKRTDNGEFVLCGHSASTDPNHNMYGVKIEANGTQIWDVNLGGIQHDGGEALLINSTGNYVFVGRTMSAGSGMRDAIMVETSTDGTTLSTKYLGKTKNDRIDELIEYGDFYYLIGETNSFSNGDNDVYFVKMHK